MKRQYVRGRWYDGKELAESVGRHIETTPCPRCHGRTRVFAKFLDTENRYRRVCQEVDCGFKEEHVQYTNQ